MITLKLSSKTVNEIEEILKSVSKDKSNPLAENASVALVLIDEQLKGSL